MFEELKTRIDQFREQLHQLRGIFDIDDRNEKIKDLEKKSAEPNFWNDNEKAQNILKNLTEEKEWVTSWENIDKQCNDLILLLEMAQEDEDESTFKEIAEELETLEKSITDLELKRMLSGEDDGKNAILTIHPGAGGTESQDWAEMLYRMYLRYAQQQGFAVSILDFQTGDEAGIKSATIEIKGSFVFGYLKAEAGVHRLVRISPFDANKRRHTSFASVFIYPEVEENSEIIINPSDIRVDTYRASGAGGQHVNKTSSAVRITHISSGIVVQCQNERSQLQNKLNAMKILAARLYKKQKEEESKKLEVFEKTKKDIAWGNQIRSYVFHPYNMVKDHRTNVETSDIQGVMDGNLEKFIKQYLLEFSG
ncbi:peptide chain release factor 2 [bacterium]